jgi:hypothetical protein
MWLVSHAYTTQALHSSAFLNEQYEKKGISDILLELCPDENNLDCYFP